MNRYKKEIRTESTEEKHQQTLPYQGTGEEKPKPTTSTGKAGNEDIVQVRKEIKPSDSDTDSGLMYESQSAGLGELNGDDDSNGGGSSDSDASAEVHLKSYVYRKMDEQIKVNPSEESP